MNAAETPGSGRRGGDSRILVIKLSALGDIIMAMPAFQAIRRAHGGARIVLLTTPAYQNLAETCGCFDEIWAIAKPSRWRPWEGLALAGRLRGGGFERVYDLQWTRLTDRLFRAMARDGVEWVGVAPGSSHHYPGHREARHIVERQAAMLALAGVTQVPPADFGFLRADLPDGLATSQALLVPGCSPRNPGKRWPFDRFCELCRCLAERGLQPILICGPAETDIAHGICRACPEAVFFETGLPRVAELARTAKVAIGNDTGPLHLIAAVGCPTVALFGSDSDPVKTRPLGRTRVLRADPIADIPVAAVLQAVEQFLADGSGVTGPGRIPPGAKFA